MQDAARQFVLVSGCSRPRSFSDVPHAVRVKGMMKGLALLVMCEVSNVWQGVLGKIRGGYDNM